VQLSAPGDYEGGRLQLDYVDGWATVPGDLGAVAVWPGWQRHQVTPVTDGERWALVAWAYGPPVR
jgi:PKHD-type hydroxylase